MWVWLPNERDPVPAGVLENRGGSDEMSFRYGERFLDRSDAISLFHPELPLERRTWFRPTANIGMPGCLRDAAPDSWGRRVILNRLLGTSAARETAVSEQTYLLESDSNRLGAIDFQRGTDEYVARQENATLDELQEAAALVEAGEPLPSDLGSALLAGTAIGGARPKALLRDGTTQYIAKFSTSDDTLDVVGAEAASIVMARAVGIDVTDSRIVRSLGRKVLLLERFDRINDGRRKMVVSALTMLGLPESFLPLGSYPDLLDVLRAGATKAAGLGRMLFLRIAFNIAISNSDDHLRNHAAFWDGEHLDLTPAYDLSPIPRTGESANQALAYGRDGQRASNLALLTENCHLYDLDRRSARALITGMIETMHNTWDEAADRAELTVVDKRALWGRQFLNPGALYGT